MTNGQWGGPPPYQQQQQASPMATVALVLGLVSWVIGGLLTAIPGAIIGKMELGKIDRGEAPEAGRTFAMIGFWASVVHIVVSLFALLIMCVIFGGAMLAMIGVGASQGGGY